MSRLLFAAARGARIQSTHFIGTSWESYRAAEAIKLNDDEHDYRIHPDDEHLQYGPISSALREYAEITGYRSSEYVMAALSIANYIQPHWSYLCETEPQRSLFLLILSECLADEGL